jgi:hypothetical protein
MQVARIWQAGRGASIDAGAFGLAARWVRRWVHWGVHWREHCNGSSIGWFLLWLLALEGHYGWRNLIRTRGHPPLVARLWVENVLKFQCLNWMLYPRVESRTSRWVWVLLCSNSDLIATPYLLASKEGDYSSKSRHRTAHICVRYIMVDSVIWLAARKINKYLHFSVLWLFCDPILFAVCTSTFSKLCKNVYNGM